MRTIWKGTINFSLVNIPIRIYSATESDSGPKSHLLWNKDLSRIRFQRVAESTGEEVPLDQIVKGFETEDGQCVVLSDEELAEVAAEKSDAIQIQEFVAESEIPSLYFEKPYYVQPDEGAAGSYALLREVLCRTRKVGIAQFVLRSRENLCLIKPFKDGLVINLLRFQSEIRSAEELEFPKEKPVGNQLARV
jgi:DNA end-binding protein Ku